jgi:hypothetical protein
LRHYGIQETGSQRGLGHHLRNFFASLIFRPAKVDHLQNIESLARLLPESVLKKILMVVALHIPLGRCWIDIFFSKPYTFYRTQSRPKI